MGHRSLTMLQRYAHVSHGIWCSSIQLLGRDIPAERPAEAVPATGTTLRWL